MAEADSETWENSGKCIACMQPPNYMTDPRLLPCGDYICVSCFEDKSDRYKFTCPACK